MEIYLLVITFYTFIYGILRLLMNSTRGINKKCLSILFILCFGGISTLRSQFVGTDTILYTNLYQSMGTNSHLSTLKSSKYPMYELYNVFLYKFSDSPQMITFFNAFIIIILMSFIIYFWADRQFMSSILYVTLYFYFYSMNIGRQFVAMSILMMGVIKLFKGKKIEFWLLYLTALLVHSTAIIGAIFYILFKIRWTGKKNIVLAIITVVILLLYTKIVDIFIILFPMYSGYVEGTGGATLDVESKGNQLFLTFFYLLFVILGNYFLAKYHSSNNNPKLGFLNASMIISTLMGLFFYKNILISRISIYFTIYVIFYIPSVLNLVSKTYIKDKFKQDIILNYLTVCTIGITFIPMIFQLTKNISGVVPYSFM
ncbi:hypothetical protein A4W78_06875 [Latilactobacillus curvatus]|nr:hypothetical protein A4W78_06875 [Latilactobacillus curvatus]